MTSSLSPGGSESVAMSLTKPYFYSVLTNCSMVELSGLMSGGRPRRGARPPVWRCNPGKARGR